MPIQSHSWWASLRHGGMLLAPARLRELLPGEVPTPEPAAVTEIRRSLTRFQADPEKGFVPLAEALLVGLARLGSGAGESWTRGPAVGQDWAVRSVTRENIRPRWLWKGPQGALLPLFATKERTLGVGRGKKVLSQALEWLRTKSQPLALVTNGRQWRLVYAGLDHDSWCESDTDLWFEAGVASENLLGLVALLSRDLWVPAVEGQAAPLAAAVLASRRGQAELSADLGERVRQAVEILVRAKAAHLHPMEGEAQAIYQAAVRSVMRLVVLLFAEARGLLPTDNPSYHASYSVRGLHELLQRSGGGPEQLRHQHWAWPRLVALFHLVHDGSHHPDLMVQRYGGDLFKAARPDSNDPLEKALAVFESVNEPPDDWSVLEVFRKITTVLASVRQGRSATRVPVPIDFRDLSSEYLGIIYEGLLAYELKRVSDGQPVVILGIGDEPAVGLAQLKALDGDKLKEMLEKMAKGPADEEEDGGEEAEAEGEEEAPEQAETEEAATEEEGDPGQAEGVQDDARRVALEAVHAWARKAVLDAGLVRQGRGRRAGAPDETLVEAEVKKLVRQVFLPGDWYLVRWGGTRKGRGSFYTRPALAVPLVARTLGPKAYEGWVSPHENGNPVSPEKVLSIKVCDPACGSGSMLVAALRFLSEALWRGLLSHGWLKDREPGGYALALPAQVPTWLAEALKDAPLEDENAETRVRAILKRLVVECCIWGVDFDPLAVELAKLALWIETMDTQLPFTFLDHKVRWGNSLVGAWFDQVSTYPIMAWDRGGGDEKHKGVHFEARVREKAIKEKFERARSELASLILGQRSLLAHAAEDASQAHAEGVAVFSGLHAFGPQQAEERAEYWRDKVQANPAFKKLKDLFDLWCALWFWPADQLEDAPLPSNFGNPGQAALDQARSLAAKLRFFHWELEFPDVFSGPGTGFNAIVGNPPWDIAKPNSKEFFSIRDPLYRGYKKTEALERQAELFKQDKATEAAWLDFNSGFTAMSNWVGNAGNPFGVPDAAGEGGLAFGRGQDSPDLHKKWSAQRSQLVGFADPEHAFRHQGGSDINLYKLFVEQAHSLLASKGSLGFIVPASIYSDSGSANLRKLLLERNEWNWLFAFENRDKIFDIHAQFKFCALIASKGGVTVSIRTSFMNRSLDAWDRAETVAVVAGRERVTRLSPLSMSFLEISEKRELDLIDKIYSRAVVLGDESEDSWGVKYRAEFHLTAKAALFPAIQKWEAKGYKPDEYGHWLKGPWKDHRGAKRAKGLILSADGAKAMKVEDVEHMAYPLYQGAMIRQFDYCSVTYGGGSGNRVQWVDAPWGQKKFRPQFLMGAEYLLPSAGGVKLGFRDITNSTNERSCVAAVVPCFPLSNKVPSLLDTEETAQVASLVGVLDSFVYDFALRRRLIGTSANKFIMVETPVLKPGDVSVISKLGLSISCPSPLFAQAWLDFKEASKTRKAWKKHWALTDAERVRLRSILDATLAHLWGLSEEDFKWVLKDTDHPVEAVTNKAFAKSLDPRGFWRVDKRKHPELRHTVLSLVAFRSLQEQGLEAFLAQHKGEGWMLPESLRLADYGLGHDQRAKEAQPVASVLGERFLPWQLEQDADESWDECAKHAETLAALKAKFPPRQEEEKPAKKAKASTAKESGKKAKAPIKQQCLWD